MAVLPTVVKTWQYSLNNLLSPQGSVAANNKQLLRSIKNILLAFASNAPTVRYSCNGTTAGTAGDGVDRWTTDADVVFATAGTAHSWFVLKFAGIRSNYQVLLSASPEGIAGTYSTATTCLSVFVSENAGFTAGSTTARPTATDEVIVMRSGSGTGVVSWGGGSPGNYTARVQAWLSSDGKIARVIVCSAGVAWGWLDFEVPADAAWSNPWIAGSGFAGATTFPVNALASANHSSLTLTPSVVLISATTGLATVTSEGTAAGLACADTTYGSMANEVDSAWPFYNLGIACPTVGIRGRMASFIDLWYGSNAVASGDTYDATSKTFAQFGSFIFPWDGSTTPILS